MKRNIYLKTIPPAEAVARVKASIDREALIREETIPSHEASGRVLAHAVHARYSAPTFHSAAMDGYAVNARSTFAAREGHPLTLKAGETCFAVNTGHPMPEGCDAVIMIEQVVLDGDGVTIEAPAFPWQHVRRIGEDIVATELLFPRNHQLRPWDVGALLSGGIWDVPVWERVTVRIIPTGDEVLDFATHPDPGKGQVVESNSQMLAALARELGCVVERAAPVPDSPEALHQALKDSLDAGRHLTIFCAGSSAGSRDFTRATLEKEGEILTHGIAAMPGKPSLLANCRGRLVAGAPGVSGKRAGLLQGTARTAHLVAFAPRAARKNRRPRRADPYRALPSGRRGARARVHRAGRRQAGRHAARTRGREHHHRHPRTGRRAHPRTG